jgi:hypothetical protein
MSILISRHATSEQARAYAKAQIEKMRIVKLTEDITDAYADTDETDTMILASACVTLMLRILKQSPDRLERITKVIEWLQSKQSVWSH